jgi:microcystin-dependent protein
MGEPYIGEIRIFAGNFPPNGWAFCDGQAIPISENDALFVCIGTTYGGDGEETFNLPNLQSRVPIHMGAGPDGNTYQIGETGGVESVTLSTNQIPIHSHAVLATGNAGNATQPAGNVTAQNASVTLYRAQDANQALNAQAVTPQGGSQPHENLQPYLCLNFILSLFGRFPSQT